MQWISSLLFGVSSSLDAFLIGISLGLRHVRLKCSQNLFISLIALLGTCLSVGLGKFLSPILPAWIAAYLGSLALILLGFYYIVKWLKKLFQKSFRRYPVLPKSFCSECCPVCQQYRYGTCGKPWRAFPALCRGFHLSLLLSLSVYRKLPR